MNVLPFSLKVQKTLYYTLNVLITVIEFFLGFRVLLKLLAANPSPFVNWIYSASSGLRDPFDGMFNSFVTQGGHVLELDTLFAMAFYALMYYFLFQLLVLVSDVVKKNSNAPVTKKNVSSQQPPAQS